MGRPLPSSIYISWLWKIISVSSRALYPIRMPFSLYPSAISELVVYYLHPCTTPCPLNALNPQSQGRHKTFLFIITVDVPYSEPTPLPAQPWKELRWDLVGSPPRPPRTHQPRTQLARFCAKMGCWRHLGAHRNRGMPNRPCPAGRRARLCCGYAGIWRHRPIRRGDPRGDNSFPRHAVWMRHQAAGHHLPPSDHRHQDARLGAYELPHLPRTMRRGGARKRHSANYHVGPARQCGRGNKAAAWTPRGILELHDWARLPRPKVPSSECELGRSTGLQATGKGQRGPADTKRRYGTGQGSGGHSHRPLRHRTVGEATRQFGQGDGTTRGRGSVRQAAGRPAAPEAYREENRESASNQAVSHGKQSAPHIKHAIRDTRKGGQGKEGFAMEEWHPDFCHHRRTHPLCDEYHPAAARGVFRLTDRPH